MVHTSSGEISLSAHPCEAVSSQPARVLLAAFFDELGVHQHCCEHANLELELMRVVLRPASEGCPRRIDAPQNGHHDLGLMFLGPLDRMVQQVNTSAHSLEFLCIEVDSARFAAWFIVKRVNALKSSNLLKRGRPVPLL